MKMHDSEIRTFYREMHLRTKLSYSLNTTVPCNLEDLLTDCLSHQMASGRVAPVYGLDPDRTPQTSVAHLFLSEEAGEETVLGLLLSRVLAQKI